MKNGKHDNEMYDMKVQIIITCLKIQHLFIWSVSTLIICVAYMDWLKIWKVNQIGNNETKVLFLVIGSQLLKAGWHPKVGWIPKGVWYLKKDTN